MINEFIDKILVHVPEKVDGDRIQEVEIYLKFIGHFELPAPELTAEEEKRQEQLRRHRIKSRERYQKIKAGEHAVGQPFKLTCKCCGKVSYTFSFSRLCTDIAVQTAVQSSIDRRRQKNEAVKSPVRIAERFSLQREVMSSIAVTSADTKDI